ncbi:MAG: 1-acyl-sn-glycerol-3-phosphate acyltransferase, partial [Sulfitobacter sp.]
MTTTWDSDQPPPKRHLTLGGMLRVALRGVLLALLVFGGLVVLLLLRLIERPIFGLHRPITPHITQMVCRAAFWVLGMRFVRRGTPMERRGAVVANH